MQSIWSKKMKTTKNLKIYNEFDENLLIEWNKLFAALKGNYNLSPEWCSIWFKHFGKKDKKLFIYTVWEYDELKLVAPFYINGNTIYLVGSNPDFYDEFNILAASTHYLKDVAADILDKELKVDFRLVNSENDFIKFFLREVDNNKKFSKKIYFSTLKPKANSDFKFEKSFSNRIKRKITSSNNKYNQKLNFEFETSKDSGFFDEMLFWHKKRWSLFQSKEKELFIKDLYYNTDLLLLSRLSHENTENTISFQLSYKYFDKISIMASAFDPVFEIISPSLLIHYHFFNKAFEKEYPHIDFGVGAYPYKYNFTNSDSLILSIKTDSSILRQNDFIFSTLKSIKTKVESILQK